jgi:hypothetical protein
MLWVIFLYCLISIGTDNIYHYLTSRIYIFYTYSSFTIVEYTFFALFLYFALKEKAFKYILLGCSLLFYIIAIHNLVTIKTERFDSFSASVEDILLIIYAIFFLYEQITAPDTFYVYYTKKFWIVIGLLIYFSATLFLFIYAATFTDAQQRTSYWSINNFSDIIKNLLFSISFTMKADKKQPYPMETLYNDM